MKIKRLMKISSEIPVASMSDIAFLLIVFFMVVAVFAIEAGFMLKLPAKDKPPIKIAGQKIIEVQISSDNRLTLDEKPMTITEMENWLKEQSAVSGKYVAIKADRQSTYNILVLVIEQFRRQGYEKISIKRLKS